jgi:hypothetical protein
MGHRANFVVIRDGRATAYYDQWAALGCIHAFSDGPEAACEALAEFRPTKELLDWSYAEGGYLIDFDQKKAIVFGHTVSRSDLEGPDGTIPEDLRRKVAPFMKGGRPYLRHVAPKWRGWTLAWQDALGIDAFAALRMTG